jgi:hypothetical protein
MDWSYDLLTTAERELFEGLSVFAGSFGLAQVAEVCASGDQRAALALIDALATKSLVTCEAGEHGTRYRLLETVRQYAAARLIKAGVPEGARQRHALAYLRLANSYCDPGVLAGDLDNFRTALEWSLSGGEENGPRLAAALGDFWLARGLLQEGRNWLERALAQPGAEQRLRSGLLRQLGAIMYQAGDLQHAEAVLTDGAEAAEAGGAATVQARIRVLLIRNSQGGSIAAALADCQAATPVLEADGDLAGLAEAWFLTGSLPLGNRDWNADRAVEACELAINYARQSGHCHVTARASLLLGIALWNSAIPSDEYLPRYEQLLRDAEGDPWTEAHILPQTCRHLRLRRPIHRRACGTGPRPVPAHQVRRSALAGTICHPRRLHRTRRLQLPRSRAVLPGGVRRAACHRRARIPRPPRLPPRRSALRPRPVR